jgi:hypothetical protein
MISLVIPMILSQWTAVPLPKRSLPEFRESAHGWTMKSDKNAGGYVYLLDQAIPAKNAADVLASWTWSVSKFPSARPTPPFKKDSDDYAVRVGFLLDDQRSQMDIPSQVKGQLAQKKRNLSYVVFYGASPEGTAKSCGTGPYSNRILTCLETAVEKSKSVSVQPAQAAKDAFKLGPVEIDRLQIVGVWVVADSDNSNSSSEAQLSALKISNPNGDLKK